MQQVFVDTFDFVIVAITADPLAEDDIQMNSEVLTHYSKAPVFAWCLPTSDEKDQITTACKSFSASSSINFYGDNSERAQALIDTIKSCQNSYKNLVEGEVKAIFSKFDYDKNNTIDKDELETLMKEFGQEHTEEQLQAAVKDLDLNGDGVISFSEFCRWYFSGMVPYNGSTRTLRKLKNTGTEVLSMLSQYGDKALSGEV